MCTYRIIENDNCTICNEMLENISQLILGCINKMIYPRLIINSLVAKGNNTIRSGRDTEIVRRGSGSKMI